MTDEYPTEAELEQIATWTGTVLDLMAYVRTLWWAADWGWHQQYDGQGLMVYQISTGGWSGNESLIDALKTTPWFWTFCWKQSRRGGHYTFEASFKQPIGTFPPPQGMKHTGYSPDEIHEIYKSKFIPKRLALADGNGEVMGEFVIGGTTTRLTTAEFGAYCDAICQWAAETLGVIIPPPGEM